jgi:hypothetical protein
VPPEFLNKPASTVNGLDYVFKRPRDDALFLLVLFDALHGMRLSCSCLPVSENGAIVPLKDTLNDGQCSLLEDSLLVAAWLEGEIEAEDPFLITRVFGIVDDDLPTVGTHIHNGFVLVLELPGGKGTATDCYLHALALGHFNAI